jgi:Holliday junction resolvase/GTPase SAR1 family protein
MIGIAFTGCAGSGKSTLANYLVDKYQFEKFSFASGVKTIAIEYFCMTGKDRDLLQAIGDELRQIDPDVWLNYTIGRFEGFTHVVIDDMRYLNEAATLRELGFVIVKLEGRAHPLTDEQRAHPSEAEVKFIQPDFVIDTSKSLEENYASLDEILLKLYAGNLQTAYFQRVKQENAQNQNYVRGRAFEYRVIKALRNRGWHCMRKFGSHDDIYDDGKHASLDVTAYKHGVYLMITCKYSARGATSVLSDPKWENLRDYAERFGAIPVFAGVDEKRRVYFTNLKNMQDFSLDLFEGNFRYKETEVDEKSMDKLIEKAWATLDMLEQEYKSADNKMLKQKWALAMTQMINILNRLLYRAGKTGSKEDLATMVDEAIKRMEEEKDDAAKTS